MREAAKFGTSGLRGLVDDLSDEVCYRITRGFLQHMRRVAGIGRGPVFVAHDLRPSSPRISAAVAAAIRDAGLDLVYAGAVPTPALALASLGRAVPGVMVTGSHIPFDRNGIKFYRPDGELTKKDEAPVLALQPEAPADLVLPTLPAPDETVAERYLARYERAFGGVMDGMRVGLYQHSAVGRDLNATLFERLGAEVVPLGRSDIFVPIDTEAVSASDRERGRLWAREKALDALVSTDGDGDRPLLGDETGTFLRGDALGILCARFLQADAVVTPVSSTTAIERSESFRTVRRTRIGSPHVLAAMTELTANHERVVGFEANGGFMTASPVAVNGEALAPLPTRDAVLPVLATVALARREGVALSGLAATLPQRFTASDRLVDRPSDASLAFLASLEADHAAQRRLLDGLGSIAKADATDGLRMTTERDEIVHLRPSGNAPEFRVYVEAASPERAEELLALGLERLSVALG